MILLSHADEERGIYYSEEALAGLRALDEVRLNESGRPLEGEAFVAAAAGCAIVVGDMKARADARFFSSARGLVAYVHGHVDARHIEVAAASANGVLVTRSIPTFGPAVVELVVGFMIDLNRGITRSTLEWRSGGDPRTILSTELTGKTLGIIGYGYIGRTLAPIAKAFGMRIVVSDPYVKVPAGEIVEQVTFDELLGAADFVVPLAVATEETENLIDAKALSRMKRSAYLINVSRGRLIDEAALEDALDRKLIAGAALDVGRALPFDMPSPRLAARDDVIATPHIGGVTPQSLHLQALETVRQVGKILGGEIPSGALNAEHATRIQRKR
jgi:D-3-phosphoglycerate dehydrogenase